MSNSHGGSRKKAGPPRRNVQLTKETALLISRRKKNRTPERAEGQVIADVLSDLAFMVSNWQALSNNAEVFAPDLLSNEQWNGLKRDLEDRTEAIGVSAFIDVVGERQRQQIEERDDDE